ncbi:MAG: cob(I)yrinic acid a,c-diamide adenosyltransferase [Peptococcaceae bacterium]|nr:cob(I)yrinic acid a,c-diamide adenosyltransferase [Peptococcaceae bacterium]
MMNIYTKSGDQGSTSLYSGERVLKSSLRVEAYGTLDELQAALGLARAFCQATEVRDMILRLEEALVPVMSEVATLGDKSDFVFAGTVEELEKEIDRFSAPLPPFRAFVLPGERQGSAALHMARTVARRAERLLWRLSEQEGVGRPLLLWLNRLSDFCFTLARFEDWKEGENDVVTEG